MERNALEWKLRKYGDVSSMSIKDLRILYSQKIGEIEEEKKRKRELLKSNKQQRAIEKQNLRIEKHSYTSEQLREKGFIKYGKTKTHQKWYKDYYIYYTKL